LRQYLVTVYDDGLNLYYGLFRGEGCCTPECKWLNIVELAEAICGSRDVDATIYDVRYCTAKVLPTATDPGHPMRQAVKIAVEDFEKEVWVASPFFRRREDTKELSQIASAYFRLDPEMIKTCQFPDDVVDLSGELRASRPHEWQ